uniref:Putative ovule protein n=1 Tax=Solanum chacoense TaxID=4108 RepID=A0A0V0GML5_SOLCH
MNFNHFLLFGLQRGKTGPSISHAPNTFNSWSKNYRRSWRINEILLKICLSGYCRNKTAGYIFYKDFCCRNIVYE